MTIHIKDHILDLGLLYVARHVSALAVLSITDGWESWHGADDGRSGGRSTCSILAYAIS